MYIHEKCSISSEPVGFALIPDLKSVILKDIYDARMCLKKGFFLNTLWGG